MKLIKYFIQFLIIFVFFLIFKILGLNFASYLSGKIVSLIGPFFRSKNLIKSNILRALPNLNENELENAKQYCKNLGLEPKTEKFAECTLKRISN